MSYARFGWEGSQVYVIPSDLGLECCGCILSQRGYATNSITEFAERLNQHRSAGHTVPDTVMNEIQADADWLRAKGIAQ